MPRGVRNVPPPDSHADLQRFMRSLGTERSQLEALLPKLDPAFKQVVEENLTASSKLLEVLKQIEGTICDQKDLLVMGQRRIARTPGGSSNASGASRPAPVSTGPASPSLPRK